jgi:hypothetical protein
MTRQNKGDFGTFSSSESDLKSMGGGEKAPWLIRIEQHIAEAKAQEAQKEKERRKQARKIVKVGDIVQLPPRGVKDGVLRLEQNLGCELPVCVSNRSDVKKESIEVVIDGEKIWRVERLATSLLPSPEHHPIWLWFLDRCQAASEAGCVQAPRIPLNLSALAKDLGRKADGRWYGDVDEAFRRLSRLVITDCKSFHLPGEKPLASGSALGTICYYGSWRAYDAKGKKALASSTIGWIAPGPLLWTAIQQRYLKAIPLLFVSNLKSYVAQRLFLYLSKHCQAGREFKISAAKLLPRIPVDCSTDKIKYRLRPHHKALIDIGFLAHEPQYDGRGSDLMVTYTRTQKEL